MNQGARLSAYAANLPSGPLAVVASARRCWSPSAASSIFRPPSARPRSSRRRPRRAPGWGH